MSQPKQIKKPLPNIGLIGNSNNRAPNKDFDSDVEDIAFDNNAIERASPQEFDCDIVTPRDYNMDTARGLLQETQSPRGASMQKE